VSAPISWDGLGFPGAMPSGESTSATLRRMQEAFAASQADLTRMEAELRETNEALDAALHSNRLLSEEYARILTLAHVQQAELVTARAELELLRAQVAQSADKEQTNG
jgi:hypothetical protein